MGRMPSRTPERIRRHYEVERELADRLRSAPPNERRQLYARVYDELFRRVPDHPLLAGDTEAERAAAVRRQLRIVAPLLTRSTRFLELGAGDCALSEAVARSVADVVALEVSEEIVGARSLPRNVHVVISDGFTVPLDGESIDLAFSHQLMEHLHPEDAVDQLREIHRVLRSGGCYVCLTPHPLSGPHDVSKYFDHVATGLHLKEYTLRELEKVGREAGFTSFQALVGGGGRYVRIGPALSKGYERTIGALPARARRSILRLSPFRALLASGVVMQKHSQAEDKRSSS
jgi:SAM-dependent methyltransferase